MKQSILISALLGCLAGPVTAQDLPLREGDWIRVRRPATETGEMTKPGYQNAKNRGRKRRSHSMTPWEQYTVESVRGNSVVLLDKSGAKTQMLLTPDHDIAIYAGDTSRTGRMAKGMLFGAVVGVIVGYTAASSEPEGECHPSREVCLYRDDDLNGIIVVAFTLGGAAVGGLIGLMAPPGEKWKRVRVAPSVGMSVLPDKGIALHYSFNF